MKEQEFEWNEAIVLEDPQPGLVQTSCQKHLICEIRQKRQGVATGSPECG
jgi:hypothetical protein